MAEKATPGPWFAVQYAQWFNLQTGPEYTDDDLLDADESYHAKENAILAASAPDLLAACQAAIHEIDQTYDGTSPPQITLEIWQQIEAAIAKAKNDST